MRRVRVEFFKDLVGCFGGSEVFVFGVYVSRGLKSYMYVVG